MNRERLCGLYIYTKTYTHSGILLNHEKGNPAICDMNGPNDVTLSVMSDIEVQKLNDITYTWNLKRQTHTNRK